MKLDVAQIFCEILSGAMALIVALAALYLYNSGAALEAIKWATDMSIGKLSALVVAAYLLGLVVDAVGLLFDILVVDRWKMVADHDYTRLRSAFLAYAPSHVFAYWSDQWAYFSCYRNLLVLMIPGVPIFTVSAWASGGWRIGVVILLLCIGLLAALIAGSRSVLKYYLALEKRCVDGLKMKSAELAAALAKD